MPRGDKSSYSGKQKRQAEHIEESERKQGRSEAAAERIAWATVNKQDGGAKGSGRKTAKKAAGKKTAAKKTTKKTATKKTAKKTASRKSTAKKAAKKTTSKKSTDK
jgi:plasmid stabilization system protein ParE